VLNKIINPVRVSPKNTMIAPNGVTSVETPSQKASPKLPDLPNPATDKKTSIDPIITLGCESGIFILLIKNEKERKIKGKKIVAKPKIFIIKSLNLTSKRPLLENETTIRIANPEKIICTIEEIV
jgi:hypothetical protein